MKIHMTWVTTALAICLSAGLATAQIGTGFTYQGQLEDASSPANGDYDLRFGLFDALSGGNQVGSWVDIADHTVTDGLFNVVLDFGAVFDGTRLWLETQVRPGADTGAHTTLSPRQEMTPVPYALHAEEAKAIVWSGGCTSHGQSPGFNIYCLNGTDFDNATSHLSVDPSGDVTVLVGGFYRINLRYIAHANGPDGTSIVRLVLNGSVDDTLAYHNVMDGTGWQQIRVDEVVPLSAGDVFRLEIQNPDDYAFHSWSSSGNYSRLQLSFVGK